MARHFQTPRTVFAGDLPIGGNHPVRLQTMWKEPILTANSAEIERRVERLATFGCELLRFAVPDEETADMLCSLQKNVSIPLVGDIHFDHKLALRCLDALPKIRINPGNIGSIEKVKDVVRKAADKSAAIRVGVNSGSLPKKLRNEKDTARSMLIAAEEELDILESLGFQDVLFSLKSSDIKTTVRANEMFAERHTYPLHLGLTEAGPPIQGSVKSAAAMVPLLRHGIGSTVRVSLSGSCDDELVAGREVIRSSGKGRKGVNIISCPRCGRYGFDVHGFLSEVEPWLLQLDADITVAVMGCVVNGPEEARHADVGISGSGKKALLFRGGEIVRRVDPADAVAAFMEEVNQTCREKNGEDL